MFILLISSNLFINSELTFSIFNILLFNFSFCSLIPSKLLFSSIYFSLSKVLSLIYSLLSSFNLFIISKFSSDFSFNILYLFINSLYFSSYSFINFPASINLLDKLTFCFFISIFSSSYLSFLFLFKARFSSIKSCIFFSFKFNFSLKEFLCSSTLFFSKSFSFLNSFIIFLNLLFSFISLLTEILKFVFICFVLSNSSFISVTNFLL